MIVKKRKRIDRDGILKREEDGKCQSENENKNGFYYELARAITLGEMNRHGLTRVDSPQSAPPAAAATGARRETHSEREEAGLGTGSEGKS